MNKSFDLIEGGEAKKFLSFRKPAQEIATLKKGWLGKMRELEGETFASKDDVNTHLDTVKYEDLETLKSHGGPFVSGKEVEMYLKGGKGEKKKNDQLYVEVRRYAKNTSLRLKHSDEVFRLKRGHKNLTNEEYVENLINYLGSVRKTSSLSSNDLFDAISKITGRGIADKSGITPKSPISSLIHPSCLENMLLSFGLRIRTILILYGTLGLWKEKPAMERYLSFISNGLTNRAENN